MTLPGAPRTSAARGPGRDLGPMQEATDLPDLFAALARAVVGALHADACLVSLLDDDGAAVRDVAAAVVPPATVDRVASRYRLDDYPLTRRVLHTGTTAEVSRSDPSGDRPEQEILAGEGFARVLMCRLALDGRPAGLIEVFRTEDRPFRRDDPAEVELLASFAANSYARIRLATKLETHYTKTIEALVSALEARDPYTEAHAGRIRDMAMALAVEMGLVGDVRRAVRLGAILHDVGKIGVSDSILLKPGPLSDHEWEAMRTHPVVGERMLRGIEFLDAALPVIRHHHERWDGRGYPDGLARDRIPLGARIVAVCDAFDAMTSDRPYRGARDVDSACRELLACRGTQFDPGCVDVLVDIVTTFGGERLEERLVRFAG
ncbi:MAG TPA: HD domain-containing phosphohydrolase [Actinomycetota bacterium]|nr:HD domain-containing phosphohydrolase [Actinomycetota bacterium]